MSSRISPVRAWRVRWYRGSECIFDTRVHTINRRFALWAARDQPGGWAAWSRATRVTVSIDRRVLAA